MATLTADQPTSLEGATPEQLKEIAISAAGSLSERDKRDVAQRVGLRPPQRWVSNIVWLLIVAAFVAVFVLSVVALILRAFTPLEPSTGAVYTSNDTLLLIFTTTSAFLIGLIAP